MVLEDFAEIKKGKFSGGVDYTDKKFFPDNVNVLDNISIGIISWFINRHRRYFPG